MNPLRRLILLSPKPQELAQFYTTVFAMETIESSANKVVLSDGVMQLVVLNFDPNPMQGLYCCGLAGSENGAAMLQRLTDRKLAISWEPDWVDDGKRQAWIVDPEANRVTIFGMN
jgi:catechol-2,3-dioxygenase